MNVLVINCGSSSLKYQLINSDSEEVLAKGLCERIGIDGRLVYQKEGMDKEITEAPMPTHKEAIQMVLDALQFCIQSMCRVSETGSEKQQDYCSASWKRSICQCCIKWRMCGYFYGSDSTGGTGYGNPFRRY